MNNLVGSNRKSERTPLLTTVGLRVVKIERMLRRGRVVSFAELRGELKVSPATVKRDLMLMRDELGAPIEWCAVARGYQLTAPWAGVAATIYNELGTP